MAQYVPYLMFAGAAVSAYGAYQQGKAAKAAAEFNAHMARQNAEIAREQTKQQVAQADRESYLRLGAIRAAQGKSGGQQQGSILDVLADTAAQNEIQRQDIAWRGELSARGYLNSAAVEEFEGDAAQKRGYLAAGSELLTGGAGAYLARDRLSRVG